MKVLHISDWHGYWRKTKASIEKIINQEDLVEDEYIYEHVSKLDYDIVIASGDMLPNKNRGDLKSNLDFQPKWLKDNKRYYDLIINSKPFFYCEGNHDFIDPCEILGGTNISNKLVEHNGYKIYGFPYIPYIAGEWNYEKCFSEMRDLVSNVPECDILVSHCPLSGMLSDSNYDNGNNALANLYYYDKLNWPKAILCGHHHNTYGLQEIDGVIISNAATTYNIIEVSSE